MNDRSTRSVALLSTFSPRQYCTPVVVNEHLHTNLMMRRPITGGGELAQRLLEVQLLEQLFLYPQWHPAGKSGRLYAQKLTGGMPDFSWLLQMSCRQGGFLSSRTLEKSGAIALANRREPVAMRASLYTRRENSIASRATWAPESEVSATSKRRSRVQSSTTTRMRKRRPSTS